MEHGDARRRGLPRVVIVGAGFAGLEVAKGLANVRARVTVVDRANHHLFQPLLYQVATAGLSPANIAVPIRSVLRKSRNTEVVMDEVVDINPKSKTLVLTRGAMSYDYLVLATGATHSYFGKEEWAPLAPGLKTVSDALDIRHRILAAFERAEAASTLTDRKQWLTFFIVGAGATGVEMAGSIAELAHRALADDFRHIDPRVTRIILVEAGPTVLSTFPERLSTAARKALERLGVEVMTDSFVEDVEQDGITVGGQKIKGRTVIWAAGVRASPVREWLAAEGDRSGRIYVNPDLSVPDCPDVFAAGDCAHFKTPNGPLPGVAPVAMQQGRYLARLLLARLEGKNELRPFRYKDKGSLATVGRRFGVMVLGRLRLAGSIAWVLWLVVHIMYLVGFRNRVLVLLEWAWAYMTYERGARLIAPSESIKP
jgi:NADH:ubiquinone reductase (H+-translocating)